MQKTTYDRGGYGCRGKMRNENSGVKNLNGGLKKKRKLNTNQSKKALKSHLF